MGFGLNVPTLTYVEAREELEGIIALRPPVILGFTLVPDYVLDIIELAHFGPPGEVLNFPTTVFAAIVVVKVLHDAPNIRGGSATPLPRPRPWSPLNPS